MKVVIATANPVKVNATKEAFAKVFPGAVFEYESVNVPSEVADQPMDDAETFRGASNRVTNARTAQPLADYWIGIEGGVEKLDEDMGCFAWIVVQGANGKTGKGRSSTFFLPPAVTGKINEGMELGSASDAIFDEKNSKQNMGTVGLLTGNLITRDSYYVESMIMALIPFRNPDLY